MRFPHSLGLLYSAFTYYTGFKVNSGEYKMMGLAPYGQPRYVDVILDKIAHICEDGSLWLDMTYFNYCQGLTITSEKFHRLFGAPPRQPESFITEKEMDLASMQAICEETVLRAARFVHRPLAYPIWSWPWGRPELRSEWQGPARGLWEHMDQPRLGMPVEPWGRAASMASSAWENTPASSPG